jgi:hypothetical protein
MKLDVNAPPGLAPRTDERRAGWWARVLQLARTQALAWVVSAVLIAVATITLLNRHVWRDHLHLFWDLKVYVATMRAQVAGLDPYARTTLGAFGISPDYLVTTPPAVTRLLGLLGTPLLVDQASWLLAAAHLAGLAATVAWSARMFFGPRAAMLALAAAAYLGLFAATGIVSLGAANLGTLLHGMVLLALGPGMLARRWGSAFAVILLATLFKPFYLAYLLVPVAAQGWSWRRVGHAGLACAGAAALYLVQAFVWPSTFRAWIGNVAIQTMEYGDIGLNLLGTRALQGSVWLALVVQAVAILGFLACAVFGRARGRERWAVLLVVALFINPRIMPYDLAVAAAPLAFLVAGFAPEALHPMLRLPLSVAGLALLQVSSYYPTGIDPHWAFPLTALLAVAGASSRTRPAPDGGGTGQRRDRTAAGPGKAV